MGKLGQEARVLVGITLALFCALWLLGNARARTEAMLEGKGFSEVKVIMGSLPEGLRAPIAAVEEPGEEPVPVEIGVDIENLRLEAREAASGEGGFEAVDAWVEVTRHPEAAIQDFIALAAAYEQVDDTESARSTLNRTCVRFPDRPEGYIALGELHEREGNLNAARFQYEMGLSYCPGDPGLRQGQLRVQSALGMPSVSSGEFDWQAWAESGPDDDQNEPLGGEETSTTESADSQDESDEEESTGSGRNQLLADETEITTLIGTEPESGESEGDEEADGTENAISNGQSVEAGPVLEVIDFRVSATTEQVTIELVTDSPAAFSTSSASDPPRLIVRIPEARIAPGSGINPSVALNVPLVDRVNLIESSADNMFVLLVVYLGEDVRHSVASDARSVRVTIGRATGTDTG